MVPDLEPAGRPLQPSLHDGVAHADEAAQLILKFLHACGASLGSSKSLVYQGSDGHSVLPFLTHMSGLLYLCVALVLNVIFLYYALALKLTARQELPMRVFKFSVTYLMWLFAALLADHYVSSFIG